MTEAGKDKGLHRALPGISAGAVNGILAVMLQISFAAMIFSGELAPHFARGIGLTLLGGVIFGGVLALTSSVRGAVAIPQDAPCAILGLAAASVAAGMGASPGSSEVYFTVAAVIAASSLLTGTTFYLLGRFRLGNLIRFIPYPVVGGFLAGIGWLLFKGGAEVMTGLSLAPSSLPELLGPSVVLKWAPGFVLACVLLFVSKRFSHFAAMPATLVASVVLFYLALVLVGMPVSEALARGWLLGPFPEGALWTPLSPSLLKGLDWGLILDQAGSMGTVVVLSTVSILLNASGLELVIRRDIDLNRELKAGGLANVLAGLGGSPAGYPALSLSALGHKLGADSRWIGLTSAGLCGIALLIGAGPLSYLPRCLAGALLLFVGVDMLLDWLHKGWNRLPRMDYTLVVLILAVIGVFGFLQGVAVGIVVAVILFIVRYSRVDVVRLELSGRSFRSNVERAVPLRWMLRKQGDAVRVFTLQGFLFFGTANRLFERVRARVSDARSVPIRFFVFDFGQVTGLDSSALNSFARMAQLAENQDFALVFTRLSTDLGVWFEREGLLGAGTTRVRVFEDLDRAMEFCEERILAAGEPSGQDVLEATYEDAMKRLQQQEDVEGLMRDLAGYVETRSLTADTVLIRQGDPPSGLYFVETGEVTAWFEEAEGKRVRFRTCGMGSVVGELGLYTDAPATATVSVTRPSVIHHLDRPAFERLEQEAPELAARLHRTVARQIAERLADAGATVQSVL